MEGNTSINPFFYGTYLGETKPGEPVTRTKKQAFQADAVGAAHQLTPAHFNITHTFRVEWQPGHGGRIDWFSKGHRINSTLSMEGDGLGDDWVHAYSITDKILKKTTGAFIPIEPTYLIFNTAVSSTWGFPYDTPEWCKKCYDCDDPKCSCTFSPGFCKMLRETDVAMLIDSVRVYQSKDPSLNHTVGCDPPDYPTRDWIKGHSYRYMRNAPFSYDDHGHYLKNVQRGGGKCESDDDCGAHLHDTNWTDVFENEGTNTSRRRMKQAARSEGRGQCVPAANFGGFHFNADGAAFVCRCNPGFTGPHCLAQDHIDDTESAYKIRMSATFMRHIPNFFFTPFLVFALIILFAGGMLFAYTVAQKKRRDNNFYKI